MNIIKSIYSGIKASAFLLGVFSLSSCLENGDETIILETDTVMGIPSDSKADPNPVISDPNADIPNIQYITEKIDGQYVMRIDMTGIQDPNTKEWLQLFGISSNEESTQNIWVSVDNNPKGFIVKNNSSTEGLSIKTDIVFLVDNSGSMSDEANKIADDITDFAETLKSSGLDIKFGCVGYGGNVGSQYNDLIQGYGITGGMDISDYNVLYEFLNERDQYGVKRTIGFWGKNQEILANTASLYEYNYAGGECGVQALRFADEHFTFRTGANRIYINFTDDYNYPGGSNNISINYVESYWNAARGVVYTVISGPDQTENRPLYKEPSYLLSEITGGITYYTNSSFEGINLTDLPVTGAMQNSYVIYFTNIKEFMDGKVHQVKITVLSEDGTVRGEKIFNVIFEEKEEDDTNDEEDSEDISKDNLIGDWKVETYLFEVYKDGKLIGSEVEGEGEDILESFSSRGIYVYHNDLTTGKWTLSSNKLTIEYSEDDTEVWTITKLTSSEMVRELEESEGGYVYKYKITSKKL